MSQPDTITGQQVIDAVRALGLEPHAVLTVQIGAGGVVVTAPGQWLHYRRVPGEVGADARLVLDETGGRD